MQTLCLLVTGLFHGASPDLGMKAEDDDLAGLSRLLRHTPSPKP